MKSKFFSALGFVALVACSTNEGAEAKPASNAVAPTANPPAVAAADAFGEKLDPATPFVALVEVVKDPKAFEGKRVRTRGAVVAVCQAAGCWADLRPEGDPKTVVVPTHVTMHDHAFFLPKTAKSKVAEVEGVLAVRTLSQTEVDHYNSEGASLTAGTPVVSVDALGIVLR